MKVNLSICVVGALMSLQGCSDMAEKQAALQDGIPLVNVIREPNGKETVLSGSIQPKMDFSSTFSTRSADGIECTGQFNSLGRGAVNCTNGWKLNLTIPKGKYGTLSGSYAETDNGIGAAVGWGKDANADLLRSIM